MVHAITKQDILTRDKGIQAQLARSCCAIADVSLITVTVVLSMCVNVRLAYTYIYILIYLNKWVVEAKLHITLKRIYFVSTAIV